MKLFRNIYEWFVSLFTYTPTTPEQDALRVLEKLDNISEPLDPHPKGTSTFDPNSERAIQGLDFQNSVFEQLKEEFPDNSTFEETWNYFKNKDPDLTVYELACLEKEWGDITFVHEGQRFWVECCFAMGEKNSWFCEMKRIKFRKVGDSGLEVDRSTATLQKVDGTQPRRPSRNGVRLAGHLLPQEKGVQRQNTRTLLNRKHQLLPQLIFALIRGQH